MTVMTTDLTRATALILPSPRGNGDRPVPRGLVWLYNRLTDIHLTVYRAEDEENGREYTDLDLTLNTISDELLDILVRLEVSIRDSRDCEDYLEQTDAADPFHDVIFRRVRKDVRRDLRDLLHAEAGRVHAKAAVESSTVTSQALTGFATRLERLGDILTIGHNLP